jgi:hypothetical protein
LGQNDLPLPFGSSMDCSNPPVRGSGSARKYLRSAGRAADGQRAGHTPEGTVEKVDLKRELQHLYLPSAKHIAVVDVPAISFLMLDGQSDPNTSQAVR